MKSNLKILVLIGIPASGKSTWAKDYVRNHADYARVCRDDFRLMLKNASMCENKIEDMITALVHATVDECLNKKLNVIVDNTHLRVKYINDIIQKFQYRADIDYRVFDISLKKAIEYDSGREAKVGAGVIEKMFKDYKILMVNFDFQPVKMRPRPHIIPDFDSSLPPAVIFDIDGTIAHMGNRGPFDWGKVFGDDLNRIVSEHITFHVKEGRKIIMLSGRDSSCRKETQDWLEFYGLPYDELHMRPAGDFRKDTIIKREIYNNEIKNNYNVLCVYDDRLSVLDMWNKEGLFTFNVNQGNQSF